MENVNSQNFDLIAESMLKTKNIRILAGAIIRNNDKILVCPVKDKIKNEKFYRIIGGGVEFGEKIEEALRREIKEEINSNLENIKYLGFLENIFEFEGRQGHEIFFIYQADLSDKSLYGITEMKILDGNRGDSAVWVDITLLKNSKFYPDGIENYIINY